MHRSRGDGYLSLGHDENSVDNIPQTPGFRLEEDGRQTRSEEEDGRALIQTDEEETVRFIYVMS